MRSETSITSSIACSTTAPRCPCDFVEAADDGADAARIGGERPTAGSSSSSSGGLVAMARITRPCAVGRRRCAPSSLRTADLHCQLLAARASRRVRRAAPTAAPRRCRAECRRSWLWSRRGRSRAPSGGRTTRRSGMFGGRPLRRSRADKGRRCDRRRDRSDHAPAARSPLMALNRVVLPAPFGPMTATTSPVATVRLTPDRPPGRRTRPRRRSGTAAARPVGRESQSR